MAEGTVALSIPGLVLTCAQYFVLLQLGRNFESDFGSCHLELQWVELRIRRWGKAAGITNQSHEAFTRKFESEHSREDVDLAYDTWEQISIQLQRAQQDSQRMLRNKRNPAELEPLMEDLQLQDSKTSRTNRILNKLKSGYETPLQAGSKVVAQSKWALYKRTQFQDLIKTVREHITALELILPEQERKLVATEAAAMDEDAFETLTPFAEDNDPLLAAAMKGASPRKGFLYEKIVMTEQAKAHLGQTYAEVPQQEGFTTYREIRTGGDTMLHAGNNYGSINGGTTFRYW